MIFTDRTITVQKGVSSLDETVVLYRGDKEVEIRFTLNEKVPFKFGSGTDSNIIEKTEATYGQLVIKTPNGLPSIFSEVTPTNRGKIVFKIAGAMIDEITEVGNYTFQIRLLDESRNSRATIPEVANGIEIREPIALEDISSTNEVEVAAVGYALTTAGTQEDTFDAEGNYNKTTWTTGDRITAPKLNKIEAGIDGVNKKLAEASNIDNAELIDGRIGADGTVYDNIGSSIRTQVNQLKEGITDLKLFKNKVIFDFNKNESNGFLLANGYFSDDTQMRCIYTDDIDCKEGDVFLYKGFAQYQAVSCLFKKDNSIVNHAQYDSKNAYTEVTIPSGVNRVVFASFEYTTDVKTVTFDLKKKDLTLGEKVDNIEIENNGMRTELELLNQNIDCTKPVIQNYTTTKEWLDRNGITVTEPESACTDYIICDKQDKFYVTGHSQYETRLVATYDESKNFLRVYGYDSKGASVNHVDFEFLPKDDEKFVRFSSYQKVLVVKKAESSSVTEYVNEKTQVLFSSNILYGKKYVACGDSFTEGDFTGYEDENGLSGTNSPVIYDTEWGMYKTYPWWISRRNGMKLVNEAKCGSIFTNYNNGQGNPFSVSRYLNVPKDADYITLMFGLNELNLTDEQIGNKTDSTNTTLWGAYNIVFEHFLTNIPYAKIGVIIADAWMSEKYANAVKAICAHWGIPVLDLKFDNNIPMGIFGRPGCSDKARELRDKVFKVSNDNSHPSVKAHEYRSTIIENFLRSL